MQDYANGEERGTFQPLLDLATPELYLRNPFRVLSLPMDATSKDVQRRLSRRKMQDKLGLAPVDARQSIVAPLTPPTDEEIRAATDRLSRPTHRMLDELFWFWPTTGDAAADPAINALEAGEHTRAATIWESEAKLAKIGQIALHNLAVLDHLIALDTEARLASQPIVSEQRLQHGFWVRNFASGKVERAEQNNIDEIWLGILSRWKQVIDGDDFWEAARSRIRTIDDAQLTTGLVRRVRETLPVAIQSINAQIGLRAAERGNTASARRQMAMLRKGPFGAECADQAIRESLRPLRNRIKTATDTAKNRWTNAPHHGDRVVRQLHDQAKGFLALIDATFAAGDPMRISLHDALAEAMLLGEIAFGNKTNDWSTCVELINLARPVAEGGSLRSQIDQRMASVTGNFEYAATDWYSREYWDLPQEVIQELEIAHSKVLAGDFNGAIEKLVVLDPKHGKPVQRALAACFNLRGVREFNSGFAAFDSETPTLKRIMDNLKVMGYRFQSPSPHSSTFASRPPCLCCWSTSYTSWMNFNLRGDALFMCSRCWSNHERETHDRQSVLHVPVRKALEYLILADEVDSKPNKNLNLIKTRAMELNCGIPRSTDLRKSLGVHNLRPVPKVLPPTLPGTVCHFCGAHPAEPIFEISVALCGEPRSARMLLHKGTEYSRADITVPRCKHCRADHEEFPRRVEKWRSNRLEAAANKQFPDLVRVVQNCEAGVAEIGAAVEQWTKSRAAHELVLENAKAIGKRCELHGTLFWRNGLCSKCNPEVFHLGAMRIIAAIVSLVLGVGSGVALHANRQALTWLAEISLAKSLWSRSEIAQFGPPTGGAAILFFALVVLTGTLKLRQWARRRALRRERLRENALRRSSAMAQAQTALDQSSMMLKSSLQQAQVCEMEKNTAKETLEAAKRAAIKEFDRAYPEPTLKQGIKPEAEYLTYNRVTELKQQGWEIGTRLDANRKPVVDEHAVKGLVSVSS